MKGYKPNLMETASHSQNSFLELGIRQECKKDCKCDKCKEKYKKSNK